MPTFLVEALAQYRMVYAVEASDAISAQHAVSNNQVQDELGQKFLGEIVISTRQVDLDAVVQVFDDLSPWTRNWTREQKLECVHVCDKQEDS